MIEDSDRRNISGLQKKIATDETYLNQDRNRQNITGLRTKIATDETYLDQYCNRQNILDRERRPQ